MSKTMKQTLRLFATVFFLVCSQTLFPQVAVNTDGSAPNASAMFDIKSTTKGLLIPRMTTVQMNLIGSPAAGLMLYNTTDNNFYFHNGSGWGGIVGSSDGDWTKQGSHIYSAVSGNVGIGITAPTYKLHVTGTTGVDAAIMGHALGATGLIAGVRGESEGDNGRGMFAWATHTTGVNYGIFAATSSPNGYSGYFTGGRNYFQGFVGMGTNAPTQALHVSGQIRLTGNIYDENNTPGTYGQVFTSTGSGTNWVDQSTLNDGDWNNQGTHIYNANAGNVGIGTTAPASLLHATGDFGALNGRTVQIENTSTATTGQLCGLYVTQNSAASSNAGAAIVGLAASATGTNTGVRGQAAGDAGKAISGLATHSSGFNIAVYGNTASSNGYAGYFVGGKNYLQGNVGIGTSLPDQALHLSGNLHITGNIYDAGNVAGTSGQLLTSNGTGTDWVNQDAISDGDWTKQGTHIYSTVSGNVGIGITNPSSKLHVSGNADLDYPGVGNGATMSGSTPMALLYVSNAYAGNTWGISAGLTSASAGSSSYGLYGFNYGSGYGVYGVANLSAGTAVYGDHVSGNYGYLGSSNSGAYGYNANGNFAYLATSAYGVFGQASSGNKGYLGGSQYGVIGDLEVSTQGAYAVYGYGLSTSGINGTGYGPTTTLGGVKGYNLWGNTYTFGVGGFSDLDYDRSGGVIGARSNELSWGSLGYKTSASAVYGGYFTSYTFGTGKSSQPTMINSGIGAWGDLFGADIHGQVYGAYIEGGNYASYSNGTTFKNGLDVHLQQDNSGKNVVLYTNVTTDATVQTCGIATLSGGKCEVSFDPSFAAIVSETAPVVVTITPMGNSGGVYLSVVTTKGFSAVENNGGKSSVTISYIAIGKRAGYENPELPMEVLASDYTEKLSRGLHNDGDTKTDGEGLYYENGKLTVGKHPSTLSHPNKPAPEEHKVKIDMPKRPAPATNTPEGKAQ
jgi:hypothetical protein